MSFENGITAGWTLYFPLTGSDFSTSDAISLAILSLHFLGASSEAGAITFLATVQISRNSGIHFFFKLRFDNLRNHNNVYFIDFDIADFRRRYYCSFFFFERHMGYSGLSGFNLDSAGDPVAFQHLF